MRVHNLRAFCQQAAQVEEDTWLFHLWHGDFSRWLRDALHEDALAQQVAAMSCPRRQVASRFAAPYPITMR